MDLMNTMTRVVVSRWHKIDSYESRVWFNMQEMLHKWTALRVVTWQVVKVDDVLFKNVIKRILNFGRGRQGQTPDNHG